MSAPLPDAHERMRATARRALRALIGSGAIDLVLVASALVTHGRAPMFVWWPLAIFAAVAGMGAVVAALRYAHASTFMTGYSAGWNAGFRRGRVSGAESRPGRVY